MGARNTGSIRGNGYVHYTDCDDGLDLNTYVKTDIVHIKYVQFTIYVKPLKRHPGSGGGRGMEGEFRGRLTF